MDHILTIVENISKNPAGDSLTKLAYVFASTYPANKILAVVFAKIATHLKDPHESEIKEFAEKLKSEHIKQIFRLKKGLPIKSGKLTKYDNPSIQTLIDRMHERVEMKVSVTNECFYLAANFTDDHAVAILTESLVQKIKALREQPE